MLKTKQNGPSNVKVVNDPVQEPDDFNIIVLVSHCPYCGRGCSARGYSELHIFPQDQTSVVFHDPSSNPDDFCEIPAGWDENAET